VLLHDCPRRHLGDTLGVAAFPLGRFLGHAVHPVADDAAAVVASRRQEMDRALEAVDVCRRPQASIDMLS